ncbi:hypothetical protein D3C85_700320 [compost metagenome]
MFHAADRGVQSLQRRVDRAVLVVAPDPEARAFRRRAQPGIELRGADQHLLSGRRIEPGGVIEFLAPVIPNRHFGIDPVVHHPGGPGSARIQRQIEGIGVQGHKGVVRPRLLPHKFCQGRRATARSGGGHAHRDDAYSGRGRRADAHQPRRDGTGFSAPRRQDHLRQQESQRRQRGQHVADQLGMRQGKEQHHDGEPDDRQAPQIARGPLGPECAAQDAAAP